MPHVDDIAIRVEGLGKRYRIGARRESYYSLRDRVAETLRAPFRRLGGPRRPDPGGAPARDTLWALRDVSFEVRHGEVVGIIGRNGAGKSTLLKVLSRITEPTEGGAEIRGLVGSLLEVGTGFHPELTGRENIYLNGAILGMRKADIERRFDEIVAFSEVERFIDTPVKHYSSGMYVRLAFAVAAHLEPHILIIDEVLAVGDAAFQRKCLGKMGNVAREGRTVLFVSHNMQAVRQLCRRAILLESGTIQADGPSSEVTERYMRRAPRVEAGSVESLISGFPSDPALRLEHLSITQNGHPISEWIQNGLPVEIEIRYQVLERTTGLRIFFDLCDSEDMLLFRSFHDEQADGIPSVDPGRYISKATIPADFLAPTTYELRIYATIYNVRDCTPGGIRISLVVERTGRVNKAYLSEPIRGKIAPLIPWTTRRGQL